MSGFEFEKHSQYCTLRFTPAIAQMPWAEVEAATRQVNQSIHDAATKRVLVDLSQLQKIPAGLVASLVRTWKERDQGQRTFVVVTSHSGVREELDQAGLSSLWKIVPTMADAYTELGVVADTDLTADRTAATMTASDRLAVDVRASGLGYGIVFDKGDAG